MVEHIYATTAIRASFVEEDGSWRGAAMDLYECQVQQFLQCLFVLVQLAGPPLRGPESMSITWRNTAKPRGIYLKHGRVMLYTTYHKGQAQWGSVKDNVRFLPTAVGNLLLNFLVYIQPVRGVFDWQQHGRLLSPFLWSKDGQVWHERGLTPAMRRACSLAEVPGLSESHWRQICASIVKMKFGAEQRLFGSIGNDGDGDEAEDADDGEEVDVAVLARMSSHTVRTHNRSYANETGLAAANVWDGLIRRSYRASMLWASFFRFYEDVAGLEGDGEVVAAPGESKRRRGLIDNGDDGRSLVKRVALGVPIRVARVAWSSRTLLAEARRLYRDPKLRWRSREQEQAVCAITGGAMEVVVVMATGTGKSILFQLPCQLAEARTSVLIVPLVALRLDPIRRCYELGIDCVEWRGRHTAAGLVMMSVEAAASDEGRAYLYALHHARQLDRIVIDECHLIVGASSYRRAMSSLALLRSIAVPFVYLTVTLPRSWQSTLSERHFLTQVVEAEALAGAAIYGMGYIGWHGRYRAVCSSRSRRYYSGSGASETGKYATERSSLRALEARRAS